MPNNETVIFFWFFIKYSTKAERKGFEPPVPFWGTHAFQACLLNHSSISPSFLNCKSKTNKSDVKQRLCIIGGLFVNFLNRTVVDFCQFSCYKLRISTFVSFSTMRSRCQIRRISFEKYMF